MYCARCGTQIPDDSEFCYSCGAQIVGVEREKRRSAAESGETIPQPVAPTPAPQAVRPAPRTVGAATMAQPYVGVAVIVGAALAAIGCLLPWIDAFGQTANGFDFGFVLDSNGGDGKDGLLIIPIAVVAAVLGGLHFKARNSLASLAVIALGAAIVGIAGYNLWKVFDAADSMKYVGVGLYMTIAGGLVTALAGLLGPRMSPS